MNKYTPNRKIVKQLLKIRHAQYVQDAEYNFIKSLVPNMSYAEYTTLWRCFVGTVFYCEEERRLIPVNGMLFPLYLFEKNVTT